MGESLVYSWLRHIEKCQIVQTNWKTSSSWQLQHKKGIERLMNITAEHFRNKYSYNIYNKEGSYFTLLKQAEIDLVGICISENGAEIKIYAVDVAFHENGLNYGSKQETIETVTKKLSRAALCMIGYFGIKKGEIIFASPKIGNAIMKEIEPCVADLNTLFVENNYQFTLRIIANDDFNEHILEPTVCASDNVADTSELFLRGHQLIKMFKDIRQNPKKSIKTADATAILTGAFSESKIGEIAQKFLRKALEDGKATEEEIRSMQTKDYSKKEFGINYPLLVLAGEKDKPARYYADALLIRNVKYYLCSEWYEISTNNDRPFLIKWLDLHGGLPV